MNTESEKKFNRLPFLPARAGSNHERIESQYSSAINETKLDYKKQILQSPIPFCRQMLQVNSVRNRADQASSNIPAAPQSIKNFLPLFLYD